MRIAKSKHDTLMSAAVNADVQVRNNPETLKVARAARRLKSVARKAVAIMAAHSEAEDFDAAFDGGEFSGPAHSRMEEKEITTLAEQHGFTYDAVMDEVNRLANEGDSAFDPAGQPDGAAPTDRRPRPLPAMLERQEARRVAAGDYTGLPPANVLEARRAARKLTFNRFTKEDWYGWAGAESFPSGGAPFIMDCPAGLIVADEGSVALYTSPADGNAGFERNYVSDNHEHEAEVVLTALCCRTILAPETFLAFGFKEVL